MNTSIYISCGLLFLCLALSSILLSAFIADFFKEKLQSFIYGMFLVILLTGSLYVVSKDYKYQMNTRVVAENHRTAKFRLLEIVPPKHVYVDLIDLNTMQVYSNVFVAKHCNDWKKNNVGDVHDLQYVDQTMYDFSHHIYFKNLSRVFCQLSD